jgi:hypothetical protein
MSKMDAIEVRIYGCENRKEGGRYEGRNSFGSSLAAVTGLIGGIYGR